MSRIASLISFLFLAIVVNAQQGYYSISFKDKACSETLSASDFLSQKALNRRAKSNINISWDDYPLCNNYVAEVIKNSGVELKNKLKWTNEITIAVTNDNSISKIKSLPFVKSIQFICKFPSPNRSTISKDKLEEGSFTPDYGKSKTQLEMISMNDLQRKGFLGKGMLIAVFDAGFRRVDTMQNFQSLWKNKQIVGQRDFVGNLDSVFYGSNHGMSVLSTMAINLDGEMIGSAPSANYYLMLTEDSKSETLIEEYNWAEAAELADSIGADVINSSLGYTVFDDTTTSHTYADLDGNTTVITRAANRAFEKGILVVNSAGNSGNRPWYYIGAPADGYGVFSIGAVDGSESLADFSSHGPTSKGVTKPDVCAMGSKVFVVNAKSEVDVSFGTSFSGPIIAGSAACLWQSHPELTNKELMDIIRKSAHLYKTPNNDYGYGIPNFNEALNIAYESHFAEDNDKGLIGDFLIYPNPTNNDTKIEFVNEKETANSTIEIYNSSGSLVILNNFLSRQGHNYINVDCSGLLAGVYIVRLNIGGSISRKNLVIIGKEK